MAKKPRTPDPPRKVQAPKVRHKQAQKPGFTMPGTNVFISAGLFVIAGLVVALFLVLSGSKHSPFVTDKGVQNVTEAMTATGCTFKASRASAAQRHMQDPNEKVVYKTFPASSGVHNSSPAIWGNYRNPADPRQVVHNLEHGGIIIWTGPEISAANRSSLDTFYEADPNGIVITPLKDPYLGVSYPKHDPLGSKIAMTVWTVGTKTSKVPTAYVAICPSYDEKGFAAFRNTFRAKGPEPFPLKQLTPGS
jgi:hypothetical protein